MQVFLLAAFLNAQCHSAHLCYDTLENIITFALKLSQRHVMTL